MTSSGVSENTEGQCRACGGPVSARPQHGYPVLIQLLFGISFAAFLLTYDKLQSQRPVLWVWSAVQISLGIALIRGRLRARKRVLRCIRCGSTLG